MSLANVATYPKSKNPEFIDLLFFAKHHYDVEDRTHAVAGGRLSRLLTSHRLLAPNYFDRNPHDAILVLTRIIHEIFDFLVEKDVTEMVSLVRQFDTFKDELIAQMLYSNMSSDLVYSKYLGFISTLTVLHAMDDYSRDEALHLWINKI